MGPWGYAHSLTHTLPSIPTVSRIALAFARRGIALSVLSATRHARVILIFGAHGAVAKIAHAAGAFVRANGVGAFGVRVAIVRRVVDALVDVQAVFFMEPEFAGAGEAAWVVVAPFVWAARGARALVDVCVVVGWKLRRRRG